MDQVPRINQPFDDCSCPEKPLKHTTECQQNQLKAMHVQLASTAAQIEKGLGSMAWCDERETAMMLKLNEELGAVIDQSTDLDGLESAQMTVFVIAYSALMFAQAALIAYFEAWNFDATLSVGKGTTQVQ